MSIKLQVKWTEKMKLQAQAAENQITMDAHPPFGQGSAMTPKELVVAGLCGCTGMDVLALLKKHKQNFTSFNIEANVPTGEGHPVVFSSAELVFKIEGEVDPLVAVESVKLSQTKYCGVSAMLSKSFPITYKVLVNDTEVGSGEASFE
ncbi:MAG: OsmC family protein [Bdellovibrionota bacterium]